MVKREIESTAIEDIMIAMSKDEVVFYVSIGIATFINEIGIQYGYTFFTFPLSLLFILWLGLKLLPFPLDENHLNNTAK